MDKKYARAAVRIRKNASEKSVMRAELKAIKAALKALDIELNMRENRFDFDTKRGIEVKVTKHG